MKRFAVRLFPFAAFLLAACGGQSCSCLQPIQGGFPTDKRQENAAQVRVTQGALDYFSANGQALVSTLLPGGMFNVPSSCGSGNQFCCLNGMSQTCPINIGVQSLALTPAPPNVLHFAVVTTLVSPMPIPVTISEGITASCYFAIDTTKGTAGFMTIELDGDLTFTVDSTTDLTSITLANVAVNDLDSSMLDITAQSGIGNQIACGLTNLGFIKSLIISQLTSTLSSQIQDTVSSSFCAKCTTQVDCDSFADSCTSGQCMRQGVCVQEIGAQGKLDVGSLLSALSSNQPANMDIIDVLGGYAEATPATTNGVASSGLSLGLLGGGQADPHSACVPTRPAPMASPVPKWAEELAEVEPANMQPFHVGIGIHQGQLNTMGWAAFDAGALCLHVGTDKEALLDTKTLSVLMPSLADLVHDPDAPVFLVMRPAQEPTLTIGAGTFNVDMNGNKTIKEPLLNIAVPNFSIDFYAWVDQRYVRIMTLTGDLAIPVSLDVDSMGQIVPLIGDLTKAFTNAVVTNSDLLAESPAHLAAAFPMLLGVAVGQVGSSIKPIALPALMGLKLSIVAIEPTDNLSFLSIFANVGLSTMDAFHADTRASIAEVQLPPTAAFSVDGEHGLDPLLAPRVVLDLSGAGIDGSDRGLEWSLSWNGGATWSPWTTDHHPTVSDVTLWLQGHHSVTVRARAIGAPATTDATPVDLPFIVDTIAPTGSYDLAGDEARFSAHDAVSPDAALSYRVSLDGGASFGEWRHDTSLADPRLPGAQLVVQVVDEVGNVGSLEFHGHTTNPMTSGCGCTVGGRSERGAGALAALALLAGLFVARRRRALSLGAFVLLACGLAAPACHHDDQGPVALGKGSLIDPVDEVGRFSDTIASGGVLHVSGYDDSLGDLAYTEIAESAIGQPIQWQWVDGVPLDGNTPDPNSYRMGILDPGDDVGQYTSLALTSGGDPRIAYYDATHGLLKFAAARDQDRAFTTSIVEMPASGSAGLYASLSLDAHDVPSIAYLATGIPDGMNGFIAKLRLATAKTASPQGPGDWTIVDVDKSAIPCANLCPMGQACIANDAMDVTKGSACHMVDSTPCPTMCSTDEACIAAACVAAIANVKAPELPHGTGLFAQLRRLKSGSRAIVYYDYELGDLKLAMEGSQGSFTVGFIDGMDPSTDVGQFASAMVAPDDTLHVAYVDAIGDRLLYKQVKGGMADAMPEVIDDGTRTDGAHPVGGGASLWTDGSAVRVLYQDQAASDLWQATRGGGSWVKASLDAGSAGYGFYPRIADDAGALFMTEFVYDRSQPAGSPIGLLEAAALK